MTGQIGHSSSIAQSRRRTRFVAAAALAALAIVALFQFERSGAALALLTIAALPVLWAQLRHPRPGGAGTDLAGKVYRGGWWLVAAGLAVALVAFAVSRLVAERASVAALCPGQSAQLGRWNLALADVTPVAREGFTALQAQIAARRDGAPAIKLSPQLRSYFAPAAAFAADSAVRERAWNGDLVVRLTAYDSRKGCLALHASWQPFLGFAKFGSGLAAAGSALMAAIAFGSLSWRQAARARIDMRREDRPLPGGNAHLAKQQPVWQLCAIAMVLALSFYLVADNWFEPPPAAGLAPFAHGPELVAARQSLADGPPNLNQWLVIGDAMARRGRFADAAEVLLGATERAPHDPQGWLALGDALFGHAGGHLSAAAELAYDRADLAAMRGGAPPLLAGLAMERSGRSGLAQQWWLRKLSQAASDAPWRAEIAARLAPDTASR